MQSMNRERNGASSLTLPREVVLPIVPSRIISFKNPQLGENSDIHSNVLSYQLVECISRLMAYLIRDLWVIVSQQDFQDCI